MKRFVVTLSLVILLSMPVSALAEKLVFATSEWPPYAFTKDGQPSGINVEIIVELCKRLGMESEIRVLPWQRALNYVEGGKVDAIFSVRHTDERATFLHYPAESINTEKTIILAQKGSGIKATNLGDLKDKKVGIVRGYEYGLDFDKYQEIKRTVCDDDAQLVTMFAKKRVELAAGMDEGSMRYLCKKAGVDSEVVYVLSEVPSYIGFSKKLGEKGKALADKFSEALKKLKEEGFIEKVQSKYF